MCAIGVYKGVRDAGLQIGTDVSVAGFDDISLAQLIQPTLTTVHQPLDDMARIALERLITMIQKPNTDPGASVRIAPRLMSRESTAGVTLTSSVTTP